MGRCSVSGCRMKSNKKHPNITLHRQRELSPYSQSIIDKENMSILTADQKARLLSLREQKEVGRFLLPDAPERKQKRKVSTVRIPCPLTPGTPATPPTPQPRPWNVRQNEPVASTSNLDPTSYFDGPVCACSSPWEMPEDEPVPSTSNWNPTPSLAEGSPWLTGDRPVLASSGGPTETAETVVENTSHSKKKRKLVFSPSTGIKAAEPIPIEIINADIELLEFTPTSSTREASPSSSAATHEPLLLDDPVADEDDMVAEWEREWEQTREENPGSDIDEDLLDTDIVDIGARRCRNVEEYPADLCDLPPRLLQQMAGLDACDDSALRQIAGSDLLHFDWNSDSESFTGVRETFTGPSGPTFSVEGMTPLDIFERIWDEPVIDLIVTETNRYAHQLLSFSRIAQQSRIKKWKDVTKHDIWTFFAIIMLHSIIPNPVEKEYWYPLQPYLQIGNFKEIMPYKRFTLIKKCLHFVDNTSITEGLTREQTRLTKIVPILNHLNEKFSSLYLPEQNIAIDESLLLWKGRLSFSQLIATKAARVGIKSYELCESRTGYLWKMEVYAGKSSQIAERTMMERELNEPEGATSQIVYRLVRPLLGKGHTLLMDNFYNSPLLSRTLKCRKTDTVGTLRLNRQFVPDSLRNKTKTNMRTGEIAFSQTQDLSIVVWKDANVVSLISTYHKVEVSGKEKHGFYKFKPQVVLDYNLSMGGVDKKDQLLQAFPVERIRNTVWYKKVFRRLLNISIHNAYVMYCHVNNIFQRQFRVELADQILKKYKSPLLPLPAQPKTGHFPTKTSGRTRCRLCAKKKINVRTVWACDTCQVGLCINGCFKDYHTT